MFKPKVISFELTAEQFARLPSLFFSLDERLEAGGAQAAAASTASPGLVGKLEAARARVHEVPLKDAALEQRILDLLQSQGLQRITIKGFYRTLADGAFVGTVSIAARAPSFVVRLLFDEKTGAAIQVKASEMGGRHTATVHYVGRHLVNVLGCIVVIVAFGACILPGLAVLYFMHETKKTWSGMTEAVATAVRETLGVSS